MRHLTVRNLPPDLAEALRAEKARRGTSLNQTVIDLLAQAVGVAGEPRDNGLGRFVGGWSEAELREFERATEFLRRIDDEMWE